MKAPTLREAQIWMVSAITGSEADAGDLERFITAGPRLSAAERFAIYTEGYRARLVECLLDDYPVLASMLGEGPFEVLCRAYIDRHPSTSPNLNGFGRHLPAFCRETLTEHGAFAAELATLEWALVEVLHEECPPALELSALAALAPEAWAGARFIRSEALRLLHFEYPVNAVFIANRIDGVVPEIPAPSRNAVAVYRKDTQLWRMDLTAPMVSVVAPLLAGKTLGEALEAIEASETDPEVLAQTSANLMVWFREWTLAGFFTRIELSS